MDLEEQKALLAKAKAELDKLQSAPVSSLLVLPSSLAHGGMRAQAPIEKLLKDNGHLKRDREKFQECIRSWEARKKSLINNIANLNAELTQQSKRLARARSVRTADEHLQHRTLTNSSWSRTASPMSLRSRTSRQRKLSA